MTFTFKFSVDQINSITSQLEGELVDFVKLENAVASRINSDKNKLASHKATWRDGGAKLEKVSKKAIAAGIIPATYHAITSRETKTWLLDTKTESNPIRMLVWAKRFDDDTKFYNQATPLPPILRDWIMEKFLEKIMIPVSSDPVTT